MTDSVPIPSPRPRPYNPLTNPRPKPSEAAIGPSLPPIPEGFELVTAPVAPTAGAAPSAKQAPAAAPKAPVKVPPLPEGFDFVGELPEGYEYDAPSSPLVQGAKEFAKGIIPGIATVGTSAVKGVAAQQKAMQRNANKFGAGQLAIMDRIDRGEVLENSLDDAIGYAYMDADQRRQARAELTQAQADFKPGDVKDSVLFTSADKAQKAVDETFKAAPGWEDSTTRTIGSGIGSVIGAVGASAVTGPLGAATLFAAGGSGEAVDRAVKKGATEEQIITAANLGVIPGLTDSVPIETLLGNLPTPAGKLIKVPANLLGKAIRVAGKIGWQATIEGVQEGGQQFLQNAIAKDTYDPDQPLIDGVGENATVGTAVGALVEGLMMPFRRRGGGSSSSSAPTEAPTEAPIAPEAPVPAPAPVAPDMAAAPVNVPPPVAAAPPVAPPAAPPAAAAPAPAPIVPAGPGPAPDLDQTVAELEGKAAAAVAPPALVAAETIKGSAVRRNGGPIYEGAHHFAAIEALAADEGVDALEIIEASGGLDGIDQGFVTSAGRFVGREEASRIAQAADQINGRKPARLDASDFVSPSKRSPLLGSSSASPETSLLVAAGYDVDDIADMSAAERALAVQEAVEQGVVPLAAPVAPAAAAPVVAEQPAGLPPIPDGFAVVGSRKAPALAVTPEDIALAAANVAQPTEAQKAANNYRQGHIDWNGLKISIETPKGAMRTGTSQQGEEWSVEMPAHYGSIKGVKGADGDQLDVYIGDAPEAPTAFILDQIDPDTGMFDESKIFIGVPSPEAVAEIYGRAFSDGRAAERIGEVTGVTIPELKEWIRSGQTSQPYAQPAVDVGQPGSRGAARMPAPKKRPVIDMLKQAGGVYPRSPLATELAMMGVTPQTAPGLFKVTGMRAADNFVLDEHPLFEGAQDDGNGYIPQDTILEAIREEIAGRPMRTAEQYQRERDSQYRDEVERELDRIMAEFGLADDADARTLATRFVLDGMSPEQALERAIIQLATEELTQDARDEIEAEVGIPFFGADSAGGEDRGANDGAAGQDAPGGIRGADAQPQADGGARPDEGAPVEEVAAPVAVEPGAEGKPQTVIPGAEQISAAELAKRKADAPKRGPAGQRDMDVGMFGSGVNQTDLLDMPGAKPAAKPKRSPAFDDYVKARAEYADAYVANEAANPQMRSGGMPVSEWQPIRKAFEAAKTRESAAQDAAAAAGDFDDGAYGASQEWQDQLDRDGARTAGRVAAATGEDRVPPASVRDKAEWLKGWDQENLVDDEAAAPEGNPNDPMGGRSSPDDARASAEETRRVYQDRGFRNVFGNPNSIKNEKYYTDMGSAEAGKLAQGWLDGKAGAKIAEREPWPKGARTDTFNPRDSYLVGYWGAVKGAVRDIRTSDAYDVAKELNGTPPTSGASIVPSDGYEVDAATKVKDPEDARTKGGRFTAVARRLSPWSSVRSFADTEQEAQRAALRLAGDPAFQRSAPQAAAEASTIPPASADQGDATARDPAVDAKAYVLNMGRTSKTEVLVALGPDGEIIERLNEGKKSTTGMTPKLMNALRAGGGNVVVHHNHPSSRSFSTADLGIATFAGTRAVYAHGHNGTSYRVEASDQARAYFARKSADEQLAVMAKLIDEINGSLRTPLSRAVMDGVSSKTINETYHHLHNTILHDAGIVSYWTDLTLPARLAAHKETSDAMKAIAETLRKRVLTDGTDPLYAGQPDPVRQRGDLAEPFAGGEGATARPVPAGDGGTGPSGNQPEEIGDVEPLVAAIRDRLLSETGKFKTIIEARKFAIDNGFALTASPTDTKRIEETIEHATVLAARRIVARGSSPAAIYDRLVDLYDRQPNLGTRTSQSMAEQAYSTPVPLAYLASRLAGVSGAAVILEPTAGNGALLIEADPGSQTVYANELNDVRADNLRAQGYDVTREDATELDGIRADVVIANPPFGAVREGGVSRVFEVDGYKTTAIDQAIAMQSLQAMTKDGRAVLIVGSVKEGTEETRSDGYSSSQKRKFYSRLYGAYNVVDHFTVSGKLYGKQGAGWPVDVIVVDGKGASSRKLPAAAVPTMFDSWESLKGKLDAQTSENQNARRPGNEDARPDLTPVPEAGARVPGPGGRDLRGGSNPVERQPMGGNAAAENTRGGGEQPDRGERGGARGDRPAQLEPAVGGKPAGAAANGDAAGRAPDVTSFGSILDSALDDVFGVEPTAPAPVSSQRTAGAAAASAAQNTKSAMADVAAGLEALFGGKGKLSSGLTFDEETYAKAKPLFIRGIKSLGRATTDIADMVRALVRDLAMTHGMSRETIKAMSPYLERFTTDVASGKISLDDKPAAAAPIATAPAPSTKSTAVADASAGQIPYEPRSERGTKLNTLVPAGLGSAMQQSLDAIEDMHGDIDTFVADRLGYKLSELPGVFSAEQIDAIALAIASVDAGSGFIIGDQTGIGKGRVVAAAIRYAHRQGMTPLFVTEKPDLYGDMYRDLTDIRWKDSLGRDPVIFMTNAGTTVPLDDEAVSWIAERDDAKAAGEPAPPRRGEFMPQQTAAKAAKQMQAVLDGSFAPDVIFTTYDQMSSVKGEETPRRQFADRIIARSFLIMDEAHNAGGQGAAANSRAAKSLAPPRALKFREWVQQAGAVMYSSATYAKNPNVMDLYSRTDMAKAVENIESLSELITQGGVPLQQVVASMLAKSGQYARRERSFEGVEYGIETAPVDADTYGEFAASIRGIFNFDRSIEDVRAKWAEEWMKENGADLAMDNALGEMSANSTGFSSVMHNIVNQMVLAIKADSAADRAIKALQDGEKPVITLSFTAESFVSDYAAEAGIVFGDTMEISFGDVIRRYLDRTRRITIKMPDDSKMHLTVPVSDLPGSDQRMYEELMANIEAADFSKLPVSPIDWIRHRLTKAGYSVREITGRKTMIDYSNGSTYVARPAGEQGSSGKRVTIAKFNDGSVDVAILNRSGSTGVSLHASGKFKDKRRRRMIVLQADPNIDTHMQMLGRVHRTGQVIPPAYSQMTADMPAEARPTAVLLKKMASLNANTTASRKSKFSDTSAVDFMNEYGDEVAAGWAVDNFEQNYEMGEPVRFGDNGSPLKEGAMQKLTGRLMLLDPARQSELLDTLTTSYEALLIRKEAMGENALEAKTMDLQAQTIDRKTVKAAKGRSPFEGAATIERVSVKSQGRAMKPEEVISAVAASLGDKVAAGEAFAPALRRLEPRGKAWKNSRVEAVQAEHEKETRELIRGIKAEDTKTKAADKAKAAIERWTSNIDTVYPGAHVVLTGETEIPAVVTKIEQRGKAKSVAAASDWLVTFAIPDSTRQLTLPFSQIDTSGKARGEDAGGIGVRPAGWSDTMAGLETLYEQANKEGREERYIVTGNLLGGYDTMGGKGQIVQYTNEAGEVNPGLLMSRGFSIESWEKSRKVRFATAPQVLQFLDQAADPTVEDRTGTIVLTKERWQYRFTLPSSRSAGGKYFTDATVRAAYDQWKKQGNRMVALVDEPTARNIVDAMQRLGATFVALDEQDLADKVVSADLPKSQFSEDLRPSEVSPTGVPAFNQWFGNSKVVSKSGKPMVVYHGTNANFESFKAFSHFGTSTAANERVEAKGAREGSSVIPVYLSIQNPLRIQDVALSTPDGLLWQAQEFYGITDADYQALESYLEVKGADEKFYKDFEAALRRQGYDGFVYPNIEEDKGSLSFIALSPTQVKSVNNQGTYRSEDPRMTFSPNGWGMIEANPRTLTDEDKAELTAIVDRVTGGEVPTEFRPSIKASGSSPGAAAWGKTEDFFAAGQYQTFASGRALVVLSEATADQIVAYHEAFHDLQRRFITQQERAILLRSKEAFKEYLRPRRGDAVDRMSQSELEADAFGLFAYQEDAATSDKSGLHIAIRKAWRRILRALRRVRSYMQGMGLRTTDDIFAEAYSGSIAARAPATIFGNPGAYSEQNSMPANRRDPNATFHSPQDSTVVRDFLTKKLRLRFMAGWPSETSIRRKLQDRFIDVQKTQDAIKAAGGTVGESYDTYLAESLYAGRTGYRLNQLRTKNVDPLIADMKARGVTPEQLARFLYARHAPERNAELRKINPDIADPSGMSDAEAARIMAATGAKRADYDALAARVDGMITLARENLLSAGLISQEMYDAWVEKYDFYVPLRGFESDTDAEGLDGDSAMARTGRGFDVRGPEARRALGRESEADNPILYAILQAEQSIIRAEKNRVLKTFLRLAKAYPNKEMYEIDKREPIRTLNKATGLVEVTYVPAGFKPADNVVSVKVGGKAHYITIHNPNLARNFRMLGNESLGIVLRWMGKFTRLMSAMSTKFNPEFLVSNFARDVQTAVVHLSEQNRKGLQKDVVRDIRKAIVGSYGGLKGRAGTEWQKWFQEYSEAGGKIEFFDMNTVEEQRGRIERALTAGKVRRTFEGVADFVDVMNGSIENGVRLSTYANLRRRGATKAQAASAARELTVNFNRKGEWGAVMNSLYMFSNAAVQGNVRMVQSLFRSKWTRRAALGMAAVALSADLFNYLVGGDDDDDGKNYWDKVPAWEKERNLMLAIPGRPGEWIKIPLPYGYNVFYLMGTQIGAVGRRVFDGAEGSTPAAAAATVLGAIGTAFSPIGGATSLAQFVSPTITDPMVQIAENKAWNGAPIRPKRFDETKPEAYETFKSAPQWAKSLAQFLNSASGGNEFKPGTLDTSPENLEHIANFMAGGAGAFALRVVDLAVKGTAGEDIETNRIPFLRSVYSTPNDMAGQMIYYDLRDQAQIMRHQIEGFAEANDKAAIKRAEASDPVMAKVFPAFMEAEKAMRRLRKQERAIMADDGMPADRKKNEIERVRTTMEQVMTDVRRVHEAERRRLAGSE